MGLLFVSRKCDGQHCLPIGLLLLSSIREKQSNINNHGQNEDDSKNASRLFFYQFYKKRHAPKPDRDPRSPKVSP